jgi:hypothetical protein
MLSVAELAIVAVQACQGIGHNQLHSLDMRYIMSYIGDDQCFPSATPSTQGTIVRFTLLIVFSPPPLHTHHPPEQMEPTRRSERLQKAMQDAPVPGNITNKRTRSDRKSRDPGVLPIEHDPPPGETDPAKVNRPISTIVHENLKSAWAINKALPMCFIFDTISPARQFKRGTPFDEQGQFPEYSEGELNNVTETDGDPIPWMPYVLKEYQ